MTADSPVYYLIVHNLFTDYYLFSLREYGTRTVPGINIGNSTKLFLQYNKPINFSIHDNS